MDNLTSSQKTKLSQLRQFTNCSTNQGLRALRAYQWNVESAINHIFEEGLDDDDDDYEDPRVSSASGRSQSKMDFTKIDKWFDTLRDEPDSIEVNGIVKFSEELGIDPETDPVILIIAEIMKAKHMLHFSREEFRTGMAALGCDSSDSLRGKLPALRNQLNDKRRFKEIYTFLYTYALDIGQKVMTKEMALGLWKLLFPGRFALLPKWIEYFEKFHKHGVSKDLWTQFLVFTELPGIAQGDYTAFDKIESWPLVLDDFVGYLRSGGKQ